MENYADRSSLGAQTKSDFEFCGLEDMANWIDELPGLAAALPLLIAYNINIEAKQL